MDIPFRKIIRNVAIFGVVISVGGEFLFRQRYVEPAREATPLIEEIQQYLILDDQIGFKWKPNISASENIVFPDQDQTVYPLSTDADGFINSPEAIATIEAGHRPHIVGVGDSFLEHGAHVLTDYFGERGLTYRNMAMHRQSPAQFTDIVETYAISLQPDLIVYSIYENDFQETGDYKNWEETDLDWFAFHSGTWCGTPLATSDGGRLADAWVPGYRALYRLVSSRLGISFGAPIGIPLGIVPRMRVEIVRAREFASEAGIDFVVLLIPSRGSVVDSLSTDANAYDRILFGVEDYPVIDLREIYGAHSDPSALYYKDNGHWNASGIKIAADEILNHYRRFAETESTE